ncbi:unnamed protein product [Rodentolepis nana]|uniref:Transmembrane protein n=1 Tax=Rodentolepis nana TaxID=102285 RepID=A0A0R3T1F0_RODNA|nr:unnamed protein product [Rodentolepis nana]
MMCCPRQPEESEINSDFEKPEIDNTSTIGGNCSIAGQISKISDGRGLAIYWTLDERASDELIAHKIDSFLQANSKIIKQKLELGNAYRKLPHLEFIRLSSEDQIIKPSTVYGLNWLEYAERVRAKYKGEKPPLLTNDVEHLFDEENTISRKSTTTKWAKMWREQNNAKLISRRERKKSHKMLGLWNLEKELEELENRYIPLSKRFLFRELCSDVSVLSPTMKETFEDVALYIDEKISDQYRLLSEESMLLFQPLMDAKVSPPPATDALVKKQSQLLSRKERLDNEYWFLRKLDEISPAGGFSEISQEALHAACLPRPSRSSNVKTYVDPADYDVLRVWTRGLHPSSLYHLDRSLKQRPIDQLSSPPPPPREGDKPTKTFTSRVASLNRWLERLTSLVGPKPLSLVPSDYLCYNHVLLAYRLKGDNSLCLRMLKHVPVSPTASGNLFAEGVVDMLPVHRFVGLSESARTTVVVAGALAGVGLVILTPLTLLLASTSATAEVVLAWSLAMATTTGAIGALAALRYWKARADWSERLRKLTLVCEFNSGGFALAHFLGLAQAELFKSALLVYALLLQPSECKLPLKRSQLEIRAESWIAKRLSPHSHISLPASTEESSSSLMSRLRQNAEGTFNGGSGPYFDLQFDAGPALAILREMGLVRGSDEDGLEVVTPSVKPHGLKTKKHLSALLSPEYQEDDLGYPKILIRQ